MEIYEEPQRCSPQWADRKLDRIADYLFQIGETIERLLPEENGEKEENECA